MLHVLENASLKSYNTFGIDVKARWLSVFTGQSALEDIISARPCSPLILGEGSNILFTHDYDGLVLCNKIKGLELLPEDEQYRYVRVGAGWC